jgi:hypothetical protein
VKEKGKLHLMIDAEELESEQIKGRCKMETFGLAFGSLQGVQNARSKSVLL